MSDLKTFNFSGLELRVLMIEGEPWFGASETCRILESYVRPDGTVNVNSALRKLDDVVDKRSLPYREAKRIGLQHRASRAHGIALVSEFGLYKLIMRSDKPEARKFQDWVTREVLPSIRKTGGYLLNEEARDTARADDRQGMPLPEGFAQVYM